MKTDYNISLIICAGGSSTRMGSGIKKEYMQLKDGTVLSEVAYIFLNSCKIHTIAVTIPKNGHKQAREAFFSGKISHLCKNTKIVFTEGGSTRQESVLNGLEAVKKSLEDDNLFSNKSIVLIHDGARPFVTEDIIKSTIEKTIEFGAAVPVISPTDTQKELDEKGNICRHLIRKNLGAVQTPQGFLLEPLIKCHYAAKNTMLECTDDTEVWDSFPELNGRRKIASVKGDASNIKITYPGDLPSMPSIPAIRIGMGTDLHRLVEGRKLWLGGIEIPSEKGELGHSDGDVLLHAICDALLGASGLGDIGSYFPPEEPEWKDADSKILLKKIWTDVKKAGWKLNNLDCVIEMEKPKFLPWRQKVIDSIAEILDSDSKLVFVKAKTNEKMDSVGRQDAVKAYCVCLLTTHSQTAK